MGQKNYQITISSFFWSIIKPYKWWFLLIFQAPIFGACFVPANNYALKLIVDQISQNENFNISQIIFPVIIFCSASILLEVFWRIANFADYKSQPKIEAEIINQSYAMLLCHNYQFFQNNLSGKTASKINTLRDCYNEILNIFRYRLIWQILGTFIALGLLFSVHFKIALIVLLWLLVFMPLMFFTKKKGLIYSQNSTAQKQKISGLINDGISNISSVLFFSARNFEKNLIKKASQELIFREKIKLKFLFINHLIVGFIYSALSISVLFLLINLKTHNLISTGDFVMVMGLMFYLIENTWGLLNELDNLNLSYGKLKESFSIFEQNSQIFDDPKAKNLVVKNPEIAFKNLSFSHIENQPIFNNFNLTIKAGEKIGIVGASGVGKSTLINLLLKVMKPDKGEILIDGQNIANVTFDSLRANIALIPQEPMLFHRSIFENISYGTTNFEEKEVIKASKEAHIHDFIINLPDGYKTLVGERGIKLSGGQRQRIAIARAILKISLLKNSAILILDEATSSLDSATENQIQDSINQLLEMSKTTVIAIAHRLSTIKHLDRILVIEKGNIVEDGNFNDLISKESGKFGKMWQEQIASFI